MASRQPKPNNLHPNPDLADPKPLALVWLRKDLRLQDNHALYRALVAHTSVLPFFLFDQTVLHDNHDPSSARVSFVHQTLSKLQQRFIAQGSSLLVAHDTPLGAFKALLGQYSIQAVYANEDYEPYALERDTAVAALLSQKGIPFHRYTDHVIFGKEAICKPDGTPYTVYTPYMKKWKTTYQPSMAAPFPTVSHLGHLHKTPPIPLPTLTEMGFKPTQQALPDGKLDVNTLRSYARDRNKLAVRSTTHIGIHLHFGTFSIRAATQLAYAHSEAWLNQLIWRNFFIMILAHFPHVVQGPFKRGYEAIPWRQDEQGFAAWCVGRTGYPIVDAGMRELNQTGLMHNRARMIAASFLTKCLLIDWRWGEAYFAEKLLDYDLALNNGNWQWVAGCGCDAAPYFRIFNPLLQAKRFDPHQAYIKQWVPEYGTDRYPQPIVDYTAARERALAAYSTALKQFVPKPSPLE